MKLPNRLPDPNPLFTYRPPLNLRMVMEDPNLNKAMSRTSYGMKLLNIKKRHDVGNLSLDKR
ncbi:hypothetical protein BgiBS90_018622, partial [Biomphalaria glabrata]